MWRLLRLFNMSDGKDPDGLATPVTEYAEPAPVISDISAPAPAVVCDEPAPVIEHMTPGPVPVTACGAEAPLAPRILRDIPDETVKALVDCLVTFILLATATTALIYIVQEPAGPRVTLVLSGK